MTLPVLCVILAAVPPSSLGLTIGDLEDVAVSMLFDPGTIGTLSLKNRLVRSATAEYMSDAEGRPEKPLAALYGGLARGGVGLIITGHCFVHQGGRCQVRMTGAHRDELIPALEMLTAAVHDESGLVVMQINHGGRECRQEAIPGKAVAPSPVPTAKEKEPPEELSEEGIREIVAAFGDAAARAKAAGFDGVQIHAAHGYLINQFSSPAANWRRDRWGGTPARRMHFLEEVAAAVRDRVGNDYPVLIKLGMEDSARDGLALKDAAEIVRHLADWGIDALEVSGGIGGTSVRKDILRLEDEAYFLDTAHTAREATDLPIILVGGLRSRQLMEEILEQGAADFISVSRPLIREPDLPRRLFEGQERSTCISCNRCWPPPGEYGIACRDPNRGDEAATRGSPV